MGHGFSCCAGCTTVCIMRRMTYKKVHRPDDAQWLTRRQVAALIGVSPRGVDLMTATGRLRKYQNGPRCVRFKRTEVEAAFKPVEVD